MAVFLSFLRARVLCTIKLIIFCMRIYLCFTEGCSSLSNRNLPPSFWNSNYIHPVPAPSHPQVIKKKNTFLKLFFNLFHKRLCTRFPICIRPTEVTQRIRGYRMRLTTDTHTRPMRTLPRHTLTITIWHSTAACLGYLNTMDMDRGNRRFYSKYFKYFHKRI